MLFKHFPTLATLVATLLTPMLLQVPLAQAETSTTIVTEATGRVIVKYKTDAPVLRRQAFSAVATAQERASQVDMLSRRTGLSLRTGNSVADRTHVVFARGVTSAELAARLSLDSDVEYAVPDERRRAMAVPNDLYYAADRTGPGQWYLRPPNATEKASINAEQAWDVTTGSPNIVVAVLDSGVRFEHPDLVGNLLAGYDMVDDDPDGRNLFLTANDRDGRDPDASDPGDWIDSFEAGRTPFEPCVDAQDSSWHGTATASLIAAQTNNGIGMASVGRTVKILPVRVLGKCGGYDSDIIAGMRWAVGLSTGDSSVPDVPVANRAKVLNISLGGVGACNSAYRSAISDITLAGAVVVASAGNGSGRAVNSPANCPGVIAVSGLRHTGTKVNFSDFGPEATISAPAGLCDQSDCSHPIVTAINTGIRGPVSNSYDPQEAGTSFSAPLVAGTVALMLSKDSTLTPLQVKLILQGTARPFPALTGRKPECTAPQFDSSGNPVDQLECECTTGTCGAGMLDAHEAVLDVQNFGIGNGLQARIDLDSRQARAGQTLSLIGSNSIVRTTSSIATYQWSIVDSGGNVATEFSNGLTTFNGPDAQIAPRAPGKFVVALTVTDNASPRPNSNTTRLAIVAREPAQSSGGGALGASWLALLGLAVLALRRTRRAA